MLPEMLIGINEKPVRDQEEAYGLLGNMRLNVYPSEVTSFLREGLDPSNVVKRTGVINYLGHVGSFKPDILENFFLENKYFLDFFEDYLSSPIPENRSAGFSMINFGVNNGLPSLC